MSKVDYLKLIQSLSAKIARYELSAAAELIADLDFKKIPTAVAGDLARLARQAHLYKESLEILHDHIHGVHKPSPTLMLEYASTLRRMGMIHQCLLLLERVEHPEKSLHQAYCYIQLWDYSKARLSLEDYLTGTSATSPTHERERIVGRLNLVSCLVFLGDLELASRILSDLSEVCQKHYHQFYLNILEMTGQIHLAQGDWSSALNTLTQAEKLAAKENGNTTLFIEKWKLVAQTHNESPHDQEKVDTFKKKIRSLGHWESLRDLDYQLAIARANTDLLNFVHFGTPFNSFKNRTLKSAGSALGKTYLWFPHKVTGSNSAVQSTVDPLDTQMPLGAFGLIQHRLFLFLLSDFYRPQTVASIFDNLFPTEIYDPISSPKRVYALVNKLQKAIETEKLPLELASTVNGYRLRAKPGGAVVFYEQMHFTSPEDLLHFSLKSKYHLNTFTPKELSQTLKISSHKAYRWIKDLEDHSLVDNEPSSQRFKLKAS